MKLIKMLSLGALASLAAMAFIGASSASAVTLCRVNQNPCQAANQYLEGTVIKAELEKEKKAVLKTNLATVECTISKSEGKTTKTSASPLPGTISKLTFEGCKTTGGVVCTVTVVNLPYNAAVAATGGGNGTLTATSGGTGNPGATVVCGTVLNCKFSTPSATLTVLGGEPAKLDAENIELEPEVISLESVCPTEAFWTAPYKVTSPTNGWVEESP